MDMIAMQTLIHKQNVERGWWDKPRSFSTRINLFHSEASEALEGNRKSLMDDKLPQYPNEVVELADCAIRIFDHLGSRENVDFVNMRLIENDDFQENLAYIHHNISQAWYSSLLSDDNLIAIHLRIALGLCINLITALGYDAEEIIMTKVEFNRTRPDHSKEAREGKHGKKY